MTGKVPAARRRAAEKARLDAINKQLAELEKRRSASGALTATDWTLRNRLLRARRVIQRRRDQ